MKQYTLQGPVGLLSDRKPGRALEKDPINDGTGPAASIPTDKAEKGDDASTDLSEPPENRSVMNQQRTRAVAGRSLLRRA